MALPGAWHGPCVCVLTHTMMGTSGKASSRRAQGWETAAGARQESPEHFHAAGAATLASFLCEWYLQGQGGLPTVCWKYNHFCCICSALQLWLGHKLKQR